MHLFVLWVVWEAGGLQEPSGQASSLSRHHVKPCLPFSLCFSSAASSLSSAAASPLSSALCLLAVEVNMTQKKNVTTRAFISAAVNTTVIDFNTHPGPFDAVLPGRSFCKTSKRRLYDYIAVITSPASVY